MKNRQLYELKQFIMAMKDKGNNSFKLALILNDIKIGEYLKALETLRVPSGEYSKFIEEKKALLSLHSELDEQGEITLYSNANGTGERRYDYGYPNIINDVGVFDEKAKELEDKYKDTLEKESIKQQEFLKTLEEEAGIKLTGVHFRDVPEMDYDLLKTANLIIIHEEE